MALPYLFLPDHGDPLPHTGRVGSRSRTPDPDEAFAPEDERVSQIRAGNEGVYERLFMDFHLPLREFATTFVGSAAVAEEIVQDIFLDLWVRRAGWTPQRGVRAYLFRAVRNRASDWARHRGMADKSHLLLTHDSGVAGGTPYPLPGDDSDIREFVAALKRVLDALPVARRQAAFLRWRHGLSFAEIADAMGTSIASVTMHVQRAREAVRPVIERFTAS